MAHRAETRDAVRRYYVHERLPLRAAADKAGVSYHTARQWKQKARDCGDDWDKARVASRMVAGGLGDITPQVLEDFILLFQATVEQIKDGDIPAIQKAEAISRLSDAYTKTMKAAGGGDQKIAKLAVALQVLEELAKYIRDQYPEHLETFALILEPFGARVSEVFG